MVGLHQSSQPHKTITRRLFDHKWNSAPPLGILIYKQSDKATIERVQRSTARFVTGDYKIRDSSVTSTIKNLGWKSY